jgi:hypothetical protein
MTRNVRPVVAGVVFGRALVLLVALVGAVSLAAPAPASAALVAPGWSGTIRIQAGFSSSSPGSSSEVAHQVIFTFDGTLSGSPPFIGDTTIAARWNQPVTWQGARRETGIVTIHEPDCDPGTRTDTIFTTGAGAADGFVQLGLQPSDNAGVFGPNYYYLSVASREFFGLHGERVLIVSCPVGSTTYREARMGPVCSALEFGPQSEGLAATELHGSIVHDDEKSCAGPTEVSWSLARGVVDDDHDGWDDVSKDNCTPALLQGTRSYGNPALDVPASWNPDQSDNPCVRLLPACSNGADDDEDQRTDYPDDPGCLSSNDENEADPVTLTVERSGDGSGDVTASGIDCGSTCTHDYDPGTSVTLTATPAAGSKFDHWTGACTGSGPCTVTMNSNHSVTAVFTNVYTLNASLFGTGSGAVTGSGINCGTTCTATYDSGTVVTLTATPDSDSTFDHWDGACTGSGPCTVTMNSDQSVTAVFTATVRYTLTVSRSGAGTGTVTGPNFDCGTTCTARYDSGTSATLTTTAAPGSVFDHWSGACSGTGACTVTMTGDREVTAVFAVAPPPNLPPTANRDDWTIAPGQRLVVAAPGVLANDTDPNSDALTARVVQISFAASEWSGLRPDGSFSYCAGAGTKKNLDKTIIYEAVDAFGLSSPTTAHVHVDPQLKRTGKPCTGP